MSSSLSRPTHWKLPQPTHIAEAADLAKARMDNNAELPEFMEDITRGIAAQSPTDTICEALYLDVIVYALAGFSGHIPDRDALSRDLLSAQAEENAPRSRILARLLVAAAAMSHIACAKMRQKQYSYKHSVSSLPDDPDRVSAELFGPEAAYMFRTSNYYHYDSMLKFFAIAVDIGTGAASLVLGAVRAHHISTSHGPRRYSDARRIIAGMYAPDCYLESVSHLAAFAGWLCFSAVRDDIVKGDEQDDESIIRAVLQHHNILTTEELRVARMIGDRFLFNKSTPHPMLPAAEFIGDSPIFDAPSRCNDERLAIPVVRSRREEDTAGWLGPIKTPDDLEEAISAIRRKKRPSFTPLSGGDESPAAHFAVSYKHEQYDEPWRMSLPRTAGFIYLVNCVMGALEKGTSVYLWMDRVYSMDVLSGDADWSAKTIEIYFSYPVIFVEHERIADSSSIWLWAERAAALSGFGCIGNWLPLLHSTDCGIEREFSLLEGVSGNRMCLLKAKDNTLNPENRVAALILKANLNSKGMFDVSDFARLVSWGVENYDEPTGEWGTRQDWMGSSASPNCSLTQLCEMPNVIRSGITNTFFSNDSTEDVMVSAAKAGGFGLLRLENGPDYVGDVIRGDDGIYSLHGVGPRWAQADMYIKKGEDQLERVGLDKWILGLGEGTQHESD